MKITEKIINEVCILRYNGAKVIPIALNVKISEKSVRDILDEYYTPTYVKFRDLARFGYSPFSNSHVTEKPVTKADRRSDEVCTPQVVHCTESEHQMLLEKIKEQEKTIETYKEDNEAKVLELQKKDQIINETRNENEKLKQINKEHEAKEKIYAMIYPEIITGLHDLKQVFHNEVPLLRDAVTELKLTFGNELNAVRNNIGTLTTAYEQLNKTFKTYDTTRQELSTLEAHHRYDVYKYITVCGLAFGTGIAINPYFFPIVKKFLQPFFPQNVAYPKNTGYSVDPNHNPAVIQPNGSYMGYGVTSPLKTSATFCSGLFSPPSSGMYNTGYTTSTNPPNNENQYQTNQSESIGTLEPIPIGPSSSEASFSTSLEMTSLPRSNPILDPLSLPTITNSYFFFLPQNLPIDSSSSFLMAQIRQTDGKQFEVYVEGFFKSMGFPVERTKETGDWGADLIIKLAWERTVIQLKQRTQHIGVDAIQQAHAARGHYKADRAMVITTSQFTKNALVLAKELGVECWNGDRLLQELYNKGYFISPEYNPNQTN